MSARESDRPEGGFESAASEAEASGPDHPEHAGDTASDVTPADPPAGADASSAGGTSDTTPPDTASADPASPDTPSDPEPVTLSKADATKDASDGAAGTASTPTRRRRTKDAGKDGDGKKKKKERRKAPWWEFPVLILVAIGIAILVKTFVVQPFYIPSDSMENTLAGSPRLGYDRILVNKPIYDFRDPHPGDIVVFSAPAGWHDTTTHPPSNPIVRVVRGFGQLIGFVPPDDEVLVKRVIATGGQTVKGDGAGHVFISNHGVNGPFHVLKEPYVHAPASEPRQNPFGPVTVPKGRLWVMGDHRTDSADSRYHCRPGNREDTSGDLDCDPKSSTVPIDKVIGKAFVVAWPPSHWRTLGTPSTFTKADAAMGPAVPSAVSVAAVAPVFVLRRRRRRRHR